MKLRSVFNLIFILSLFFTVFVKAQHKEKTLSKMNNYESLWKEVDRFEQQSLPKSAIEQTEKILKQALADKNSPQVIKALVVKNKYKQWIDKDSALDIFEDVENLISKTTVVPEKSLLHSMLAELYLNYYESDSWNIGKRTELSGFVPKDINEWSRSVFYDKAIENLNLSIKDKAALEQVKAAEYIPVITIGKDAQTYYPALYDFLLLRAIELSRNIVTNESLEKTLSTKNSSITAVAVPAKEFIKRSIDPGKQDYSLITLEYYRLLLSSLSDRNLKESILLTALSKNDYLQQKSAIYKEKYALNILLALEKEWQPKDITVEIIDNIVNTLENTVDSRRYDDRSEDNTNKTEIYNWLEKGIKQYPDYKRINVLKSKLNYLEQPSAVITGQKTYYPNKEKSFDIQYKNLNQLTVKIYKVEPVISTSDYQKNNNAEKKHLVKTFQVDLRPKTTYLEEKTNFVVDINEAGYYKIEIISDKSKNPDNIKTFYFSVSEVAVFNRVTGKNETEFYVTDRFTGAPIKGATVEIYTYKAKNYSLIKSIQTDSKGFVIYKGDDQNKDYLAYRVVYKHNVNGILNHLSNHYRFSTENHVAVNVENISIFTDRNIYRPGQIVYFKAIAAHKSGDEGYVLIPSKEYKVILYDANQQVITEKSLKTNDFGSLTGEFVLPQGGLNGNYSIQINHNREYFKVEEYKRPTFEIIFDKLNTTYKFGEAITLKGKAENFSGIKLQHAVVDYTITKNQLLWRWGTNPVFYEAGSTVTQDDGTFKITFTPEHNQNNTKFLGVYTFTVAATITDSNGATQTEVYSINVGNISMLLNVSVPERLEKTTDQEIIIKASNLDGQEIKTEGVYTIYALTEKDSIDTKVFSSKFKSGTVFNLKESVHKLRSGKYCIKAEAKDSNGNPAEAMQYFVLYSEKDKHPPIKTNEWLIPKNISFNDGKKGEVVLGVSDQDVHVLYEIAKGDKIFERKQLVLSNENKIFVLPYKAEYGDGVYMTFTYIKDEKIYHPGIEIKKEEPNKDLALKFNVFRDKLRPGQQEEWLISIQDNKGKPVFAELLASMYDVSLDKIYKSRNWQFDLSNRIGIMPPISLSPDNSFARVYEYLYIDSVNPEVIPFVFDQLNWNGFNFYNSHHFLRNVKSNYNRMPAVAAAMAPKAKAKNKALKSDAGMTDSDIAINQDALNETVLIEQQAGNTVSSIRRNFNETAFFYPQLRTNEKGETTIAFTIPESNTAWKFRALAYDKTLNIGSLEAQIISRKELMVTPNMPRFVRQGDQTAITTKISNLSDKALSGKVRIVFFNPIDESIVKNIVIDNQIQSFQIEKDASAAVTWTFTVPENIDLLGCRIIAENADFSDGEQHLLSVLPNRMLVTESMPIHINGNETKEFRMEQLIANASNTLSNYRLTFEFNSNPAWYAIQALPVLSNPENDDAINWFSVYYVNTLGSFISKSYPKVNRMIDAWTKQGETKETFYSKLQKNEELKNVLLEETPWVLEAKEETEQMQRLSLLFDLNRSKQQMDAAIAKLQHLQNPDGGWSWFKDMRSNRRITQYILYGFSQLIHLRAVEYPESVKIMQINALQYIDQQLREDYNNLKKYNKDWQKIKSISTDQLEFLYVRSNYRDIPISQETREAERFYTAVAEKNWTKFGLYERAVLAVLAKQNSNKTLIASIVKSFREHATTNETLGMFWANNRSQTFMSQSAVTVHTSIMEAFRVSGADAAEMDRMKLWLLKQKQTQKWESTPATIDAVYALLSTGTDWLSNEGQAKVTVDNKVVEISDKTLGTGYIKQVWNASDIIPNMGIVKVEQQDNQPAWGALYWQYFENMDKVAGQKGSLNVEKKLFVEKITGTGTVLVPVTEQSPLKIGDKVVIRLTVRVDRDMEFVQLKDMRASCFEPIDAISVTKWQNSILYYQTTKDASTNFYFDQLPKGTYVFEYAVYVTRSGVYSNGITTIQCLYAPEFTAHTSGIKVQVKD